MKMRMDPETYLEVFKNHWLQAVTLMNRANSNSSRGRHEEIESVLRYLDQMMLLLVEETGVGINGTSQGIILEYTLCEGIFDKVLIWSSRLGANIDKVRLHLLKMFDSLLSNSQQPLLVHKPVIRPILQLLMDCFPNVDSKPSPQLERHIVLLLHHLCVSLTAYPHSLEIYFQTSQTSHSRFLLFSMLIPYVHREASVGQQARDSLLLIMALAARNEAVAEYIVQHSDFCPVLATGLSGLYSSLPCKLPISSDDWHRITDTNIQCLPDLSMFLNSLEFCNAVVQVSHPLVRDQLLTFIYSGFLVPVIGPALHQNIFIPLPDYDDNASSDQIYCEDDFWNSVEEIVSATAYLELFMRRITEPALMQTFLQFLMTEKHEDQMILDSLIERIRSTSRLSMVSLTLFQTLLDLNCEDLMFQLVFKHLIPCTHVMISQRPAVRDLDLHGRSAEKFLSLLPSCCSALHGDPSCSQPGAITVGECDKGYQTAYMDYLKDAHREIRRCKLACSCWSYAYDGENPSTDHLPVILSNTIACPRMFSAARVGIDLSQESAQTEQRKPQRQATTIDVSESNETSVSSTEEDSNRDSGRNSTPGKPECAASGGIISQDEVNEKEDIAERVGSKSNGSSENVSPGSDEELTSIISSFGIASMEKSKDIECCISELDQLISEMRTAPTVDLVPSSKSFQSRMTASTSTSASASEQSSSQSLSQATPSASALEIAGSTSLTNSNAKPLNDGIDKVLRTSKYSFNTANIGPLLSTLLLQLENMMQNTLYVNLLLTGLIARLACFPQPLLKSFLLSPSLVFQPTVKSLIQVLGSVKHKIDGYSYTVKDFDTLLAQARTFLSWRDKVLQGKEKSDANCAYPVPHSATAGTPLKERRPSLLDTFFRRSSKSRQSPSRRVQIVGDGMRYIHDVNSNNSLDNSLKTRNAVYCALVLEEFLKELAAISQEQSIHS